MRIKLDIPSEDEFNSIAFQSAQGLGILTSCFRVQSIQTTCAHPVSSENT